jgi:hypothetical protein
LPQVPDLRVEVDMVAGAAIERVLTSADIVLKCYTGAAHNSWSHDVKAQCCSFVVLLQDTAGTGHAVDIIVAVQTCEF